MYSKTTQKEIWFLMYYCTMQCKIFISYCRTFSIYFSLTVRPDDYDKIANTFNKKFAGLEASINGSEYIFIKILDWRL